MSNNDRYLDGHHAIVTGGSRGIGAAIASALARRGARLTLVSRSREALEQRARAISDEHRVDVGVAACDVTDEADVAAAFARAVDERGAARVLVNNAGA